MEDVNQPEPKTNGGAVATTNGGATTETIADKDAKLQKLMLEWIDGITTKVIAAVRADVALRFHDHDVDDEEAHGDLKGAYDPIIDGVTVSDAIAEKAAEFKKTKEVLRALYERTLKKKAETENFSADLPGEKFGKKFRVNRHGVWMQLDVGGSELYVWRRIARTQIKPIALSRDTSKQRNWRTCYLINDETGPVTVDVGKEQLGKHANPAINKLMRHGVHVVESKEAREALAQFLRYKPKARILRAPRVGWFEAQSGHWVFVLPTETLGDAGKANVVLDAATANHGFHRSGTSAEWREHAAKPHEYNSNVVLAVGTFLAAPLLRWAGEPGGGFHLFGRSKLGKTLVGAIGQSVWGLPFYSGAGANAFGYSWESTTNRLGERAALRSDIGLSLDESGVNDPAATAKSIYTLSGELGKGRMGQTEQDFNILFFSTGEKSMADFLKDASEGQRVRATDIPAEVEGQPESAFEAISADLIAKAGRHFYGMTRKYHGEIGHDWLEHLVALGPTRIKVEIERLRTAWLALPEVEEIADQAHAQVSSVINRFALVAATLHMASAAGIVPWTTANIDKGIIACMQRWIKQRGNTDTAGELLREVRQRRQNIAATIGDRFVRLVIKHRRLVPASAAEKRKLKSKFDGFIKETGDETRILVLPEAWQRWWKGLDADAVKEHLLKARLLIPGRDGVVPSAEKIDGKAKRFYVFASAFVE